MLAYQSPELAAVAVCKKLNCDIDLSAPPPFSYEEEDALMFHGCVCNLLVANLRGRTKITSPRVTECLGLWLLIYL